MAITKARQGTLPPGVPPPRPREESFKASQLTGMPFGIALDLCLILSVLSWLVSVIAREYAWVDRRWEVFPPLCCLIVAAAADFGRRD